MAEIGGMLASAVLKAAAAKLGAAAGDRIMLQWKFSKDLEDMRDTLESIEAVLEDAERRSIEDASVRLWLERLTRASYDISDMFDEIEAKKSTLQKFDILRPLINGFEMSGKMKKVREKLENISKQRHEFCFTAGNSSHMQHVIDERETSSEVIEADILGRDEEKQKVIGLLTTPISEFIVLPIYGIGGIGKTTFAQMLFNDTHFMDYEKAWVYVSQKFYLKKIVDSIRSQLQDQSQLHITHEPNADPPALRKILIVLDDLWESDDFKVDDLKKSLKRIRNGRKVHVIVTTRDAGIAQKIQTTESYAIEPLSSDMCWTIIKQIVGFEDRTDKGRLEDTGKEIAIKCQGVALAARALGYMLRSRNLDGWVSVKENDIWNISKTGYEPSPYDNVLASLKLSYISLLPYARLCFAYCAMFPKGHKMAKDDLIYQWAALGFIKPSREVCTWQHGENCIKQLLGTCFLQHSKSSSSNGQEHQDATLFTMHDLVHDLSRSIIGDGILDASRNCNIAASNSRYVALADWSEPLSSLVIYPDKIRALRFLGSCIISESEADFSPAKYLRVLDLGECSIQTLPSSIGELKLLRYLNAPGIKDQMIPSCITKLSKLIYLNLRGSYEVLELPKSIGQMKDLMYLDLSGCSKIRELPRSLGELTNLVHLDLSNCYRVSGIPEALCGLTKLQYLNLSRRWSCDKYKQLFQWQWKHEPLRRLPNAIQKLTELRYLNLSSCVDYVCHGGATVSSEGYGIRNIHDVISTLPNLEHLDLSNNRILISIPDSYCSLRRLHTLDITSCVNLQSLPVNMGADSSKPLVVKGCRHLDMFTLRNNRNLISLPYFVVHVAESKQSSNLLQLEDVNPPQLEISCLEKATSVEEARNIKLRGKQSMVNLTLRWTRGKKGYVEDMELLTELVPPSSLENFELQGYNGTSFPAWLGIAVFLPNLVRVKLTGLSQCTSLPPLGQLPKLVSLELERMPMLSKIDIGFCSSSAKTFPLLERLSIRYMESLEEWSAQCSTSNKDDVDENMFPNLEVLTISGCHKLRVTPCPLRVRTWQITHSDGVLLQQGEGSAKKDPSTSSASVGCLRVESWRAPLHQWKLLHHLPSLNELIIADYCNDLSCSPEFVGRAHLRSLQKLSLINCPMMTSLPRWLGDLTSLQSFSLNGCMGIQELPEWLGGLVSLKNLDISFSWGIMSLPESIEQLTNLERLVIRGCPALKLYVEDKKMKIGQIKEIMFD